MSNADRSQWQFPKNEAGHAIGWRADGKGMQNHKLGAGSSLDAPDNDDLTVESDQLALRKNVYANMVRKERKAFVDVAQLLADTDLTYAGGLDGVVAGVVVRAGPFIYRVAASGATDNHVATAGGVKLFIVGDIGNVIAWGCPTDGVTSIHVVAQKMADYLATLPKTDRSIKIVFPPNITYRTTQTIAFDNPERTHYDWAGARFVWSDDIAFFDLNRVATAALPITVTADTYTKRDQFIIGGEFVYSGATRNAATAIRAFYMRGFWWRDYYVTGARNVALIGGKDTYNFDGRCHNCLRAFEIPEEGVLHAAALTGNDIIDVIISGQISGDSSCEWGVYCGARTQSLKVRANINGPYSQGHVLIKDGSVTASRDTQIAARCEQIPTGVYSIKFDASRGTGFLSTVFDKFEISFLNGGRGVLLDKCSSVKFSSGSFVDGSGGTVSTEIAIYVDADSRDIVLDVDSVYFAGVAAGQKIVQETPACRDHIALLPSVYMLDTGLNLTGWSGATGLATQALLLDVDALVSLNSIEEPILPPKAWIVTVSFSNNTGGAVPSVGACRLRLAQANEAGTGIQGTNEGITLWTGGLPNAYTATGQGIIRANDNGDVWLDLLTTHNNATVTLNVQGYVQ